MTLDELAYWSEGVAECLSRQEEAMRREEQKWSR